jgi:glutamine cyclotransferase
MALRRTQSILAFVLTLLLFCLAFALGGCGKEAEQEATGDASEAAGAERARSHAFLAGREAPVYGYEVIETYDHDPENFTEGLVLDGGILYEGTGLKGRSRLLKSDLENGEILDVHNLAPEYFGEGVTVLGDEVFQLTYTTNLGFVYDQEGLEPKRTFTYPTEGWGLTHDGESLIMSDGTATFHFLNPVSGAETGRVNVSDNLGPVANLNELEYIDGEVYANVWQTNIIAIIAPRSGEVAGWIDLAGLNPDPERPVNDYVLNGIAYDRETGHLLVTGKCWPHLYEIELVPNPPGS